MSLDDQIRAELTYDRRGCTSTATQWLDALRAVLDLPYAGPEEVSKRGSSGRMRDRGWNAALDAVRDRIATQLGITREASSD